MAPSTDRSIFTNISVAGFTMTGTLGAQAVVESAVLQPATIKLAASFQLTVPVLNAKEAGTCAFWIVISFTLTVLFSHSVPANSPES